MHGDAFFSPDDSDYERHSILRIKKSFRGTQVRYTQMTQIYTYNEKDEEGFFLRRIVRLVDLNISKSSLSSLGSSLVVVANFGQFRAPTYYREASEMGRTYSEAVRLPDNIGECKRK